MKRREAIKKTGWILKSAVFTPTLVSAIPACPQKVQDAIDLQVLDIEQFELCNAIGDVILPKTESPSASEVKVVEFMDVLLKDVFDQETVDSFLSGLQQFDQDCQQETGNLFIKLSAEDQSDYLESVDSKIMAASYDAEVPFYYTFKRLCITIYYSSEEGVKQNMDYQPVPGPFQGDVKLQAGEKISVGNSM